MDNQDYYISRIFSGQIRLHLRDGVVLLGVPTTKQWYSSCEIYNEVYENAVFDGLMTDDELLGELLDAKLWSLPEEERLEAIRDDIEELKVKIYKAKSGFKSVDERYFKQKLAGIEEERGELFGRRHALDYITANGVAQSARLSYLIGFSLFSVGGDRLFNNEDEVAADDTNIIERSITHFSSNRIDENKLRELARCDLWRNYWSIGKERVFDKTPDQLTEEQRSIFLWSRLYDSVNEDPESPSNDIVEDDDALDGWLILRRRERESKKLTDQGQKQISSNSKIANSQEVFVIAQTQEDADRFNKSMATGASQIIKRQRMAALENQGKLSHADMPDMRMAQIGRAHQMFKDNMKGK